QASHAATSTQATSWGKRLALMRGTSSAEVRGQNKPSVFRPLTSDCLLVLLVLPLLPEGEDADFGDFLVALVGDNGAEDALLADLGEELILQPAFERIAGFHLLGFLVELALDDLDLVGDRQGLGVSFLLPLEFDEGDLVAFHLGDEPDDLVREADADAQDQN